MREDLRRSNDVNAIQKGVEELEQWTGECQKDEPWAHSTTWNAKRGVGFMHASTFNKGCDMMLFLERVGAQGIPNMPYRACRIMNIGSACHEVMHYYQATFARRNGHKYEEEARVRHHQLLVGGSADGVTSGWPLKGRKVLWEYKTINRRGFAKLRSPLRDHLVQTNIYMACLDVEYAVILYIEKDSWGWAPYVVPFAEQHWTPIRAKAERIHALAEEYEVGGSPQVNRKITGWCYSCPYVEDCEPLIPPQIKKSLPPEI
jgi:hypothetical protein